jgi:hypothetical protein
VTADSPKVDPRETLRAFALFVASQDPEVLAGEATDVVGTLRVCADIGFFFRRYVAALKKRRPR